MPRILLLLALGMAVPAAPAAAGDYPVSYVFPTADQVGIVTIPGAGFAACGGGVPCRSARTLSLHAVAGVAIPARSTADALFTRPTATSIVGGQVTVRYRLQDSGVHARLIWSSGGAYRATELADRTAWTTTTIRIPAGATRVGPSLYASSAVPASAVSSAHADELIVERFEIVLRDVTAPRAVLAGGELDAGGWHAGRVCGHVTASDRGLGLLAVAIDAAGQHDELLGAAGSRLQPRPLRLSGDLCLDTAAMQDGYHDAIVLATDGVGAGGNRSAPLAVPVMVDNTPPLLVSAGPTGAAGVDASLAVQAIDGVSGIDPATASLELDGVAIDVGGGPGEDGWLRVQPDHALAPGAHEVSARVADAAGNAAALTWSFHVGGPVTVAFSRRRLALRPGPGRLRLRLTRDGEPIAGARVVVRWAGGNALGAAVSNGRGIAVVAATIDRAGELVAEAGAARATATVALRPGVSLAATARRVAAGGSVRLVGVVVPSRSAVVIEAYSGGAWHAVRTVTPAAGGRFRASVGTPRKGLYVFRASARGRHSGAVQVWAR